MAKKGNGGQFKPGDPRAGRPKGTPNRATVNAREAIARLIDGNVGRLQGWLDEIAKDEGPKAAWQCFVDLLEFSVPKLARNELTGPNDGPIQIAWPLPKTVLDK